MSNSNQSGGVALLFCKIMPYFWNLEDVFPGQCNVDDLWIKSNLGKTKSMILGICTDIQDLIFFILDKTLKGICGVQLNY